MHEVVGKGQRRKREENFGRKEERELAKEESRKEGRKKGGKEAGKGVTEGVERENGKIRKGAKLPKLDQN